MKRVSSDPIGSNRTDLPEQAGNDQDVRQGPGLGENQPALQPAPTVMVAGDRQAIGLHSLFLRQQQEVGSLLLWQEQERNGLFLRHQQEGISHSGFSAPSIQLTASQPVLRGVAVAESARESGDWQTEALAALDEAYRGELTAWLKSAEPGNEGAYREAIRNIAAYVKAHGEERELDFSGLDLSTLPPLPADLIALDVGSDRLTALPENLPHGLERLIVRCDELTALPENLPQGLKELHVFADELTALPENLPPGLERLTVHRDALIALPESLPKDLREFVVSGGKLIALPENLPPGLERLCVLCDELTALPENLPQGLRELTVYGEKFTALPKSLPKGLRKLELRFTGLTALPENLPHDLQELKFFQRWDTELTALPENLPPHLKSLKVYDTNLGPETFLALIQANTSITNLDFDTDSDPDLAREIDRQLLHNEERPARLAKAAVTLDLLTRFALTTSDRTGDLIKRGATPGPVAGGLPQQSIPAELHVVLAAQCSEDVLAVLAGMVDRPSCQ